MLDKINISFPDGSTREFDNPTTPLAVAKSLSNSLAKSAVAARFDGKLIGANSSLEADGVLEIITFDSPDGKEVYWHSASHLMAQAIKRLWPDAQIAIGPAIDNGFYYDIEMEKTLQPEDLEKIENAMRKIVKLNLSIEGEAISKSDAVTIFTELDQKYKLELLDGIDDSEQINVFRQGEFIDLCRGPHLASTGKIKNIKLTSLAGAYWRGDEKRQMLQRIYGIAFPKEQQLTDYLEFLEEAKRRDHRKIGKHLDLYSFQPEAPGFVFWHGKGLSIYNEILNYWREVHERENYVEIKTPIILNEDLWHKSGHWENYKENMYFTEIDNQGYAVKPMNCPGGLLVFKNGLTSYRDLPKRVGELGLVHRHEKSGVMHGLMRVRQFTQDDAHVYCTPDQIKDEIIAIIRLVYEIYAQFGFTDIAVELSTKPEKSIGSEEIWSLSENVLEEALNQEEIAFQINAGDGAFYGPKIDFHIKDCIGRMWQCGTIQLDFSMPERLGATYIDSESNKKSPVMIHRAILGSIERFMGILIEHYGGDFPLWLAPVQVVLIPVSEKHHEFAEIIYKRLREKRFRVSFDDRNEKVGYKIRENELQKIPYMCIIGDREIEANSISVRRRLEGDLGNFDVEDFIAKIVQEREERI